MGGPQSRRSDPGGAASHLATRRSYDAVAARYRLEIAAELEGKPLDRALLAAFAETAGAGPVADLGCGPGHVAAFLRSLGAQAVGLDLSPAMAALARQARVPAVAGDLVALPVPDAALAGVLCWYALIHLDTADRSAAYRELRRALRPGGRALLAFHTSDAEHPAGTAERMQRWWDTGVELTFRFLEPEAEVAAAEAAGFHLEGRLDRDPCGNEHPSRRTYLMLRR